MRMTPKQRKFAELVADGCSLTEAYRGAYRAENMKPAVVRTEASRLSVNPAVTLLIQTLRAKKEAAIIVSAVSDADRVREALRTWMTSAEPTDSMKIKAAELLGRTVGLFKDVQEITERPRTAAEIRAEIDERLRSADAAVAPVALPADKSVH